MVVKKLLRKRRSNKQSHPERITNETVAEHRERILAGGRRFKYPVQYARHRLVINAIVIGVIAVLLFVLFTWWQLYMGQNSSSFFYRITRVVPLPVASVEGEMVPYSNYLMNYRSQTHYLTIKEGIDLNAPDNKTQLDWIKRKAMNDAVSASYASKIARERNISVSSSEVDDAILRQRQSRDGVASVETYNAIVLDHFDWTPQEAREITTRKLLQQKVAYAVDTTAARERDQVVSELKKQSDFEAIAKTVGGTGNARVTAVITPLVPRTNQDDGLAAMASTLKKDEVSKVFKSTSGDGYYIVKLLDSDNSNRISYAYIKIPLTAFCTTVGKLRDDGKVKEFISIPHVKLQTSQGDC